MRIPPAPHRFAVSPRRAAAIQREMARQVRVRPLRGPVRLVAGVDCAFLQDAPGGPRCLAAAVAWDRETGHVLEERVAWRPLRFPYVPGLLTFREAPAVLAVLRKLRHTPDLLLCDGHGRAHPRRFGLACHVGLLAGVPTAGCAKSPYVGRFREPGPRRGASTALVDRGETIGRVLRTQGGMRPVFVSVGHDVDLPSAQRVVLLCATRFRLPEPTRLADRLAARGKRERAWGALG